VETRAALPGSLGESVFMSSERRLKANRLLKLK
jgi:hypothetical protein